LKLTLCAKRTITNESSESNQIAKQFTISTARNTSIGSE